MAKTIQPLDSYRLAQFAEPEPCYICGEGNRCDADTCQFCAAPMALAHQARSQKVQPRMLAVIGPSGVGKTVYLGMLLDMLSRQPQPGGGSILARGAMSITLQQAVVGSLARGTFPAKTPSEPERWSWVHCQIRSAARQPPLELIVPDLAGEALLEEMDHPQSYPGVFRFLSRCAGGIVLVDAEEVDAGVPRQAYAAMKILTYLSELQHDGRPVWRNRPLAIVLSKADRCESCFDDPAEFVRSRAAGLWQQCTDGFSHHRFFAASVTGACAARNLRGVGRVVVPLRIEPRGIIEPFEWLIGKVRG